MKRLMVLFLTLSSLCLFAQNAQELSEQAKSYVITKEFDKALPLLQQAADLGDAESQYNLGLFLGNGIAVEKDPIKAVEWFKKSSENGYNNGHYAMMMAYGQGVGIEQNDDEAFAYALKCAKNNDSTCMWNVVNSYKYGKGSDLDTSLMLEWLLKLARLENPDDLNFSGTITSARLNLAQMYMNGEDVSKDLYKSYLWYLIYNESKVDFSIVVQQEGIAEIKKLESKLTSRQLKSAVKDAEKLLRRPLKELKNLYDNSLVIKPVVD